MMRQCYDVLRVPLGILRCCSNFQKGCPHTTLSALKCDAMCEHKGTMYDIAGWDEISDEKNLG